MIKSTCTPDLRWTGSFSEEPVCFTASTNSSLEPMNEISLPPLKSREQRTNTKSDKNLLHSQPCISSSLANQTYQEGSIHSCIRCSSTSEYPCLMYASKRRSDVDILWAHYSSASDMKEWRDFTWTRCSLGWGRCTMVGRCRWVWRYHDIWRQVSAHTLSLHLSRFHSVSGTSETHGNCSFQSETALGT